MKRSSQSGFSYIDVMIALVILMVGILALLSGISAAVLQAAGQEQQMIAKQYATSAMESLMSVKETDPNRLGWNAVGNVGSNPIGGIPQGIFLSGFQPVFQEAGADEVIGTADDTGAEVGGLQRQIEIVDICDPDRPSPICSPPGTMDVKIRSVTVTVIFFVGELEREERVTTILTDYQAAL